MNLDDKTPEQIEAAKRLNALSEITVENMYEVMGSSSEFVLCDKLFIAIEGKRGSEILPNDGSTIGELTVQYIWGSNGLVGNRGFYSFYCQDIDHSALVESFNRIQKNEIADLLQEAFDVFPESKPLGDEMKTIEFFGSSEAMCAEAAKYERRYYSAAENIEAPLAQWIKSNPKEFGQYRGILKKYANIKLAPWWKLW